MVGLAGPTPGQDSGPGADAVFKRVRDLTLSEKRNEAERMAEEGINGAFTSMYLPLGSLHIKYNSNKAADQYSRVLNMDTGHR